MNFENFKFRIWDNSSRRWVTDVVAISENHILSNDDSVDILRADFEIELQTCLVDDENNRLYEGDIVYYDDENIYDYVKYTFEWQYDLNNNPSFGISDPPNWLQGWVRVGNIHENYNLLSKGN